VSPFEVIPVVNGVQIVGAAGVECGVGADGGVEVAVIVGERPDGLKDFGELGKSAFPLGRIENKAAGQFAKVFAMIIFVKAAEALEPLDAGWSVFWIVFKKGFFSTAFQQVKMALNLAGGGGESGAVAQQSDLHQKMRPEDAHALIADFALGFDASEGLRFPVVFEGLAEVVSEAEGEVGDLRSENVRGDEAMDGLVNAGKVEWIAPKEDAGAFWGGLSDEHKKLVVRVSVFQEATDELADQFLIAFWESADLLELRKQIGLSAAALWARIGFEQLVDADGKSLGKLEDHVAFDVGGAALEVVDHFLADADGSGQLLLCQATKLASGSEALAEIGSFPGGWSACHIGGKIHGA